MTAMHHDGDINWVSLKIIENNHNKSGKKESSKEFLLTLYELHFQLCFDCSRECLNEYWGRAYSDGMSEENYIHYTKIVHLKLSSTRNSLL